MGEGILKQACHAIKQSEKESNLHTVKTEKEGIPTA